MKETVIVYNIEGDRLSKLKMTLIPLRIALKIVSEEEFSQPIGFLLGMKDVENSSENAGESFDEELLVMSGFTGAKVERFLRSLSKKGVKIPLKAVVTETNRFWSGCELYKAVKVDHEEMSKR